MRLCRSGRKPCGERGLAAPGVWAEAWRGRGAGWLCSGPLGPPQVGKARQAVAGVPRRADTLQGVGESLGTHAAGCPAGWLGALRGPGGGPQPAHLRRLRARAAPWRPAGGAVGQPGSRWELTPRQRWPDRALWPRTLAVGKGPGRFRFKGRRGGAGGAPGATPPGRAAGRQTRSGARSGRSRGERSGTRRSRPACSHHLIAGRVVSPAPQAP